MIVPMEPRRHYLHAPITEALIDIRVKLPQGVTLDTLDAVGAAQEEYPNTARQGQVQWEFSVGAGIATSAREMPLGSLFTSADQQRVFQARVDGFTSPGLRSDYMITHRCCLWAHGCTNGKVTTLSWGARQDFARRRSGGG
ncbi:MAG: hypothetical protein DLM73_10640, partial [Chthoniobacterales bacterium]